MYSMTINGEKVPIEIVDELEAGVYNENEETHSITDYINGHLVVTPDGELHIAIKYYVSNTRGTHFFSARNPHLPE